MTTPLEQTSGRPVPVDVIRSARRKKTVSAVYRAGRIELRVPSSTTDTDLAHYHDTVVARLQRQIRADHVDLDVLAARLARRYELPEPTSIRWVGNQHHRWGSCTAVDGTIRISDRLGDAPPFVLEHVVLHELTHLVEANHGPRFRQLMARDPNGERAEGYLMALSRHDLV